MGKFKDQEEVTRVYPSAVCRKKKVKYVKGPGEEEVKEEYEVIIEEGPLAGIWGYGKEKKEAWKEAKERLVRVNKLGNQPVETKT